MRIYGSMEKNIEIFENIQKNLKIYGKIWKYMENRENMKNIWKI